MTPTIQAKLEALYKKVADECILSMNEKDAMIKELVGALEDLDRQCGSDHCRYPDCNCMDESKLARAKAKGMGFE